MHRPGDKEIAGRLADMGDRFAREREAAADTDANDRAILVAINKAISLQEGDNDSPSDSKVMAALQAAKAAQEADMREG